MFYALTWFTVFGLLALWSLTTWTIHSIAAWSLTSAGVLAGGPGAMEVLRLPAWLAPWIPPEFAAAFTSMLAGFAPAIDAVLGWAPAMAGGMSWVIWGVWAIGSVLLIVLGIVLTGLVALLRGRSSPPAAVAIGPAAAG